MVLTGNERPPSVRVAAPNLVLLLPSYAQRLHCAGSPLHIVHPYTSSVLCFLCWRVWACSNGEPPRLYLAHPSHHIRILLYVSGSKDIIRALDGDTAVVGEILMKFFAVIEFSVATNLSRSLECCLCCGKKGGRYTCNRDRGGPQGIMQCLHTFWLVFAVSGELNEMEPAPPRF